jgi:4-hydroxy-tetrahydrodipicolinate synthase
VALDLTYLHKGLYAVLVTPFDEQGRIDEKSIENLVDFYLEQGASGIVTLSVMGESKLLDQEERIKVVHRVVAATNGRVPVVVGVNGSTTSAMAAFGKQAADLGASSLLVSVVISNAIQEADAIATFRTLAMTVQLPMVVLDYPPVSGNISVSFLQELAEQVPLVHAVKLEELPTTIKISKLRNAIGNRLNILCAKGSIYSLQELQRGSDGFMTGYAYPEHLVEMLNRFQTGDISGAAEIYTRNLPLFVYCNQEGIEIALRKEILKHRGVISCSAVRPPMQTLDEGTRAELHQLIKGMGL